MTPSRNISARFRAKLPLAVTAVLRCSSLEEAAQSVAISTATLKRWMRRPQFAQALETAQKEIFSATTNSLRAAGRDCAEILAKIARDETQPAPSRVRAAMGVVGLLMKLHDLENFDVRLSRIEAMLARRAGPR